MDDSILGKREVNREPLCMLITYEYLYFRRMRAFFTIDGSFPRQDDHHQLQTLVGVFKVPEHGLYTVCSLGIFAEAGLTLDGHPCIPGDFSQLIRECSEREYNTQE